VLPLPDHDPGAGGRGAALRRAGPGGLRALRQARRAQRLQLRPPRRVDAPDAVRPARAGRRDPGGPGLGRPRRPASGRRAPRPLRPGRGGQHRPTHRGPAADRRLPGLAEVLAGVAGVPGGPDRQRWLHHRAGAGGRRGLRRALPRRQLHRRGPRLPGARADPPGRPRRAGQQGGVGDPQRLGAAAADRLLRRRSHHPGRRGHLPTHRPGAQGQPHTTIAGAGHFLQEDKGPELARVVADFVAATPVPRGN